MPKTSSALPFARPTALLGLAAVAATLFSSPSRVAAQPEPGEEPKAEAEPTDAAAPDTAFAGYTVSTDLTLGLALRFDADERRTGAAGQLAVDVPVGAGFSLRLDALGMAFTGSPLQEGALLFGSGGLGLGYTFDDVDARVLVGLTPFVGYGVDLSEVPLAPAGLHLGARLSLALHFPLVPGIDALMELSLPMPIYDPGGFQVPLGLFATPERPTPPLFPSQLLITGGIAFSPLDLFR